MPPIKRRFFLQSGGYAIATVLLNSCHLKPRLDTLRGVQTSSRKLALLVGINDYPETSQISSLKGCINDVELQRHLLIYRFGFKPEDILTLTNQNATRQGILDAFETHLIQQAKPGDIVVFHYSGHGSQVADPDQDYPDGLNSTIVPFDSQRPTTNPNTGTIVQDITGHTLFLLMTALKTENVTIVLDCCHSGGAKRGNLQIRSVRGGAEFQISPEEKSYQQKWLSRLNLTPSEFIQRRRTGVAKGIVITSTSRDQLAADYPFGGFSAGAFTYLMTQYFWQQTGREPILNALPNIARNTSQISFTMQTPELETKPGSGNEQKPIYFTDELATSAEAVITKVEGQQVELWLGGIDSKSLAAFEKNTIFAVVDTVGKPFGRVQLESRQGLVGRGKLLDTVPSRLIQPGALCLEQVRGIPPNLSLRIGLDPSLGKEMTQAKSILDASKRIEVLPLQQQEVDYIFGRMTDNYHQPLQQGGRKISSLPPTGSLGLFSPGLEVIPGSFGAAFETVKDALLRLQAKFKSLLAARILKMILNTDSSTLNVMAALSRADAENQLIAQVIPTRSAGAQLIMSARGSALSKPIKKATQFKSSFSQLPLNTPVQLHIINNESRVLYVSVLVINPTGEMTIIFPSQWTATLEAARVEAGQTLFIPDPNRDQFNLQTQEPLGVTEVLIIASVTPLRNVLKVLQDLANRSHQQSGPVALSTPIEMIDHLLWDLRDHGDRSDDSFNTNLPVGKRGGRVDTSQLAAMSITFEVV